jgi:Na+-translocating ferredoxin:NAD+ oxidoreductase RNF subunit RnfB
VTAAPGGDAGARALAQVLGVPAIPFDRSRGEHKAPQVALIVEADCIGCTASRPARWTPSSAAPSTCTR